jgi:hypothetical protein
MRHALTALGAALMTLVLTASCTRNVGRVSIVNKSTETISRATLVFSWGERIDVSDLAPSHTATLTYRVREGDFRVEVVFRSGKRLTTNVVAYVTTGVDFLDEITVTDTDIRVRHTTVSEQNGAPLSRQPVATLTRVLHCVRLLPCESAPSKNSFSATSLADPCTDSNSSPSRRDG